MFTYLDASRQHNTCCCYRNTLAARQTPAFIAEWLVLWRKADPLVVDRVFTAFRRPPYMKVILPIVLQRLVLEGAQYRTQSGLTPLGFAAHAGLTEAAQALLNANVDANEPADSHQQRALHLTQTYPIAQALITSGADVQLQDICGRLPLHAACRRGATDIVQALLAAGADPNAKDAQKATPLCYAVDSLALAPITRHVCTPSAGLVIPSYLAGLVEALVVAGADIDAYSGSGSTALHKAASAGHEGLVQALLQRGADPGLKDFMRRTAAEVGVGEGGRVHMRLGMARL